MSIIKKVLRRIKMTIADLSWKNREKYLRKNGGICGSNNHFNCSVSAFGTEPFLIEIGDNCTISSGVHLITHDGGMETLNNLNCFDGVRMDKMGRIIIGNNVYIGTNAIILPNVKIGDNAIIGAGAVVTKNVPSNMVCVGVPAKCIKTVHEYLNSVVNSKNIYPTAGLPMKQKKAFLIANVKKD